MRKKIDRYVLVPKGEPLRYLLIIMGDVEAETRGPFKTDRVRNAAARKFRRDEGDEHGIHGLDIVDGKPQVWDYSGGFFKE